MARWYQDTHTGSGTESVGFQSFHYFQAYVNAIGPGVGRPTVDFQDNLSKLGWIQIGNEFDAGDGTVRVYWRERVWINCIAFELQNEPPIPCTHFRYWLSAGSQAYLTFED